MADLAGARLRRDQHDIYGQHDFMEGLNMKTYTLIPKNGRGCTWYVNADQIFKRGLVEAFAKDIEKAHLTISSATAVTILRLARAIWKASQTARTRRNPGRFVGIQILPNTVKFIMSRANNLNQISGGYNNDYSTILRLARAIWKASQTACSALYCQEP